MSGAVYSGEREPMAAWRFSWAERRDLKRRSGRTGFASRHVPAEETKRARWEARRAEARRFAQAWLDAGAPASGAWAFRPERVVAYPVAHPAGYASYDYEARCASWKRAAVAWERAQCVRHAQNIARGLA